MNVKSALFSAVAAVFVSTLAVGSAVAPASVAGLNPVTVVRA